MRRKLNENFGPILVDILVDIVLSDTLMNMYLVFDFIKSYWLLLNKSCSVFTRNRYTKHEHNIVITLIASMVFIFICCITSFK